MNRKVAIFVVFVVAVVALLVLGLGWTRERSRRLACGRNMQRIATALTLAADGDSEGASAGGPAGLHDPALRCPSAGIDEPNYVVAPASRDGGELDSRAVLIYEPKANHGGGGNCLFADGHVSFVRGEEYDRIVRDPTGWWKSAP